MSSYRKVFFFDMSAMRFVSISSIYSGKEHPYMHNKQRSSIKQNMINEHCSKMIPSLNYPQSNFRILCPKVKKKIGWHGNFYNLLLMAC